MIIRFCADCNQERTSDEHEVISFAADSGWVAEFAVQLADGETASETEVQGIDGIRWEVWQEPVIGWAVVEKHYEGPGLSGHERRVEAVLLSGDLPMVMSEYRMERDMLGGVIHVRLVRTAAAGAGPSAGLAPAMAGSTDTGA